jgi:hypothetical protein
MKNLLLIDCLDEIIKATSNGYQVVSKKKDKNGKRKVLSKKNISKKDAIKRLKQIEYFKHHK